MCQISSEASHLRFGGLGLQMGVVGDGAGTQGLLLGTEENRKEYFSLAGQDLLFSLDTGSGSKLVQILYQGVKPHL